jgi:hypothetical protein
MHYRSLTYYALACLVLLAVPLQHGAADPPRERTVWNYDGGLHVATEGHVPGGPCFHLLEHLTADNFFENLRRVDSTAGTFYKRGNDIVTDFPEVMHLNFELYDVPCPDQLQVTGTRVYLSKSMISNLRFGFAWKHGMDMRAARQISLKNAEAHPIQPYAEDLADELPKKYEWEFEFDVPSKGVPLTDSLVLVIYSPDHHIVARVAARM